MGLVQPAILEVIDEVEPLNHADIVGHHNRCVKEVWATGQWANLLTWKVFFSLGLFVFSLFIPKIINKLKFWQGIKTG